MSERLTPRQDADTCQWLEAQLHGTAPASEGPHLPTQDAPLVVPEAPGFVRWPEETLRQIAGEMAAEETYRERRRARRGERTLTRRADKTHRPQSRGRSL